MKYILILMLLLAGAATPGLRAEKIVIVADTAVSQILFAVNELQGVYR